MAIISVRNLIYDYIKSTEDGEQTAFRALDDVSFDIEEGSFVAIVGRNGSGKSSLAKNLNGLFFPTGGEVIVKGMSTLDEDKIWDIRSSVGMVFQNPDNQIVSSTVEDDVAFGPENLGVAPAEIRRRVDEALKAVGMYEHRFKGAHMLSGGQKQRVAIAGALAMRPDCIIFDEPTAMLDPKGRDQVMYMIRQLNKEGITIVLITHFMQEAAQADRVLVMRDGRLFSDSAPGELFGDEALVREAGLEMPPAVELREKIRERGIELPASIIDDEELVDAIIAEKKRRG